MVRAVDQRAIAGATDGASAGSLSNGTSNRLRKRWIIEYNIYLIKASINQTKNGISVYGF